MAVGHMALAGVNNQISAYSYWREQGAYGSQRMSGLGAASDGRQNAAAASNAAGRGMSSILDLPVDTYERSASKLPGADLNMPDWAKKLQEQLRPWEKKLEEAAKPRTMGEDDKPESLKRLDKLTGKEECKTCSERKYQDGSDDGTVSFQSPTSISPQNSRAAVMSHELEHVIHEQADAEKEGREVVSQSVALRHDICPECGRSYVSGGTTRTATREKAEMTGTAAQEKGSKLDMVI